MESKATAASSRQRRVLADLLVSWELTDDQGRPIADDGGRIAGRSADRAGAAGGSDHGRRRNPRAKRETAPRLLRLLPTPTLPRCRRATRIGPRLCRRRHPRHPRPRRRRHALVLGRGSAAVERGAGRGAERSLRLGGTRWRPRSPFSRRSSPLIHGPTGVTWRRPRRRPRRPAKGDPQGSLHCRRRDRHRPGGRRQDRLGRVRAGAEGGRADERRPQVDGRGRQRDRQAGRATWRPRDEEVRHRRRG